MSKDLFIQERDNEQLPSFQTEESVIAYINKIATDVIDGNKPALKSYITLKRISDAVASAIKETQDLAIDNAMQYGQKSFKEHGAMVEVKSAAGKWDFSAIEPYNAINERLKKIAEIAKQAYKLKTEIPDPETGELIKPASYTEGRQTIAISFKA